MEKEMLEKIYFANVLILSKQIADDKRRNHIQNPDESQCIREAVEKIDSLHLKSFQNRIK